MTIVLPVDGKQFPVNFDWTVSRPVRFLFLIWTYKQFRKVCSMCYTLNICILRTQCLSVYKRNKQALRYCVYKMHMCNMKTIAQSESCMYAPVLCYVKTIIISSSYISSHSHVWVAIFKVNQNNMINDTMWSRITFIILINTQIKYLNVLIYIGNVT